MSGESTSGDDRNPEQADDESVLAQVGLTWITKLGSFADVLVGVGFGLLATAAWVGTMVLIDGTPNDSQYSYGTGGEARFTDIRLPVDGGVILTAGLVIVLVTLLYLVGRSEERWSELRRGTVVAAVSGIAVLAGVNLFTSLLNDRTDEWGTEGSGYPNSVLAWWLAIGGLGVIAAALSVVERGRPRIVILVAAVTTATVTVVAIGLSPVEDGSLRTEHGSLTELAEAPPESVRGPGRIVEGLTVDTPVTIAGFLSGGMVSTPDSGEKTADIVMHDFADSSVRWRLKVPADTYEALSIRTYEGARHLVVTTRIGTTYTTFGVDVFTGDVVWRRAGLRSTDDMRIVSSKEADYRLLDVPDDRSSISMTDLATGDVAWRFTAPSLCSIGGLEDRRDAPLAILNCVGKQSRLVAIEPKTGAATTVAEGEQRALAIRVEGAVGVGADGVKYGGDTLRHIGSSLVDVRTQKTIAGFRGALCDGDECLVPSAGPQRVVLSSLTASHPDVVLRGVEEVGLPVVLRHTVLWVVDGDLVIGDRRTGETSTVRGRLAQPRVVRGGVFVPPYDSSDTPNDDDGRTGLFLREVK